ncbi:hypothetical protein [Nitrosomonas communis]|uniref:hypothetical protein n=1 Tax=Nitrosomonas communis TaxID=44574 RepID=UPI003D2D68D7
MLFLHVKSVQAQLVELEYRLNQKMRGGRSTEVGRALDGFIELYLLAQFGQPLLHKPIGIIAQQQMCRRIAYVDNAKQSLDGLGQIASLVAAVFLRYLRTRSNTSS